MNRFKNRLFASVLCMVLIVAMALSMTACTNKAPETPDAEQGQTVSKSFTFEVTDKDGNTETFQITTDKSTVGAALLDEGLIVGEDGPYGLYVTQVNGIVADYDADGTYWAFYVDGEYAGSGVDTTDIVDGSTYGFKVEK